MHQLLLNITFPLYVRFMTRWFFGYYYFHGYKPSSWLRHLHVLVIFCVITHKLLCIVTQEKNHVLQLPITSALGKQLYPKVLRCTNVASLAEHWVLRDLVSWLQLHPTIHQFSFTRNFFSSQASHLR